MFCGHPTNLHCALDFYAVVDNTVVIFFFFLTYCLLHLNLAV